MSFETDSTAFQQEHFTIVEIDLPEITSCTGIGDQLGWHTPLTCQETWDGTTFKTYYFATDNVPLSYGSPAKSAGLPGDIIEITDPINPIIMGIKESPTQLRPGEGLAIQGSLAVTFQDFIGDPGPVRESGFGTYFGKFRSRNIFQNREIRIKYFYKHKFLDSNRGIYAESDAQLRTYITKNIKNNGNGTWTIVAKDELSRFDKDTLQFPPAYGDTLRTDIGELTSDRTLNVNGTLALWQGPNLPFTVFIDEEFMAVDSVSGVDNNVDLSVRVRGADIIVDGNFITATPKKAHVVGDFVQICAVNQTAAVFGDTTNLATFLSQVLQQGAPDSAGVFSGGVPSSKIPIADWLAEVAEWHPNVVLHTVWYEPKQTNDTLKQILNEYMMDMWYDPVADEVKLSAISVWANTDFNLVEGEGIDYNSFKVVEDDDLRLTRAYIYHDKRLKGEDDAFENFKKLSFFADTQLESEAFFGDPKVREFSPSHILDPTDADLLVRRTVARFGRTPIRFTWTTQEKYLNFNVGDIVGLETTEFIGSDGLPLDIRSQITEIQPVFDDMGRSYKIKALTFESAFNEVPGGGFEFRITEDSSNVNLFIIARGPSQVVDVTFVIDAATISSVDSLIASMRAGPFSVGSTITIILINGAQMQGAGGVGGAGGSGFYDFEDPPLHWETIDPKSGEPGGVVYDAEGIDTEIWLEGAVPLTSHTADGFLRAPGGGGGGSNGDVSGTGAQDFIPGDGGGGGAGIVVGLGGAQGFVLDQPNFTNVGVAGDPGDTVGNGGLGGNGTSVADGGDGGDWGQPGAVGSASGGAAGSGVIGNGATIDVAVGATPTRLINGNGDTPGVPSIPQLPVGALLHYNETSIVGTNPVTAWNSIGTSAIALDRITGTGADLTKFTDPNSGLSTILNANNGGLATTSLGLATSQPNTVFVVLSFTNANAVADEVFIDGTAATKRAAAYRRANDAVGMYAGLFFDTVELLTSTAPRLITLEWNSTTPFVSAITVEGGTSSGTRITGDSGNDNWDVLEVFSDNNDLSPFKGWIGEVVMYSSLLSAQDISDAQDFLRDKWNI